MALFTYDLDSYCYFNLKVRGARSNSAQANSVQRDLAPECAPVECSQNMIDDEDWTEGEEEALNLPNARN